MIHRRSVKEFAMIMLGLAIVAAAVFFFMLPSHVSVGSAAALAMILSNYIPLPVSAITLLMNIFLLILGFLFIGPEFGGKTVFCAVLMPAMLWVFEVLFPEFQSLTQDPVLDVVCYILTVSVGLAILFSHNASSGGLDIIGKLLNKYLRVDLGKAVASCGLAVALMSYFVSDLKIVVLSVLGTYLNGIILDYFIFGNNIKRRVCILSSKLDVIRNFVLTDLHSGATIYNAIGAYNNTPLKEIVVIVNKQEYAALMRFLSKEDPAAFVTVYNVNEVSYVPKPGAK